MYLILNIVNIILQQGKLIFNLEKHKKLHGISGFHLRAIHHDICFFCPSKVNRREGGIRTQHNTIPYRPKVAFSSQT